MRRIALAFTLAMLASAANAEQFVIETTGSFTYSPQFLTITENDTVLIQASGFHPLNADDGSINAATSDQVVGPFTAGEWGFHCNNHGGIGSGMFGSITIIADDIFVDGFDPAG